MKNPFDLLDSLPPWVVRLMAVHNLKDGTVRERPLNELLRDSKLSRRTFQRIAYRQNWNGVRYDHMRDFINACHVNPFNVMATMRFFDDHKEDLFALAINTQAKNKLKKLDGQMRKLMEKKSR